MSRKILLWALCAISVGCNAEGPATDVSVHATERSSPASLSSGTKRVQAPYPHAAWRLAKRADLQDTVLWMSHILIRHREIEGREVRFRQVGWTSMPPAPPRTRAAALEFARRVAAEARRQPERFSELAREHSDDITTAERAGSLSSFRAIDLIIWPHVLDALAALSPGEVSEVVETEFGFHIFQRRPVPPRQTVNGARIVIGHQRAEFLSMLNGGPPITRTREEGLALASAIYAELAADPSRFGELATTRSEHPTKLMGGDMGEWLTDEASDYPMQVEVLSQIAVGQVAAPVETLFGWEVLMRTPNTPRDVYAMTAVEIGFDVDSSGNDASEAAALERASELAEVLRASPERFEALQRAECCLRSVQLPDGKGWPPLLAALKRLRLGEIAPQPIRHGMSYIIPKRIEPQPLPPRTTRHELPSPHEPDLAVLFGSRPVDVLRLELRALSERARDELGLSDAMVSGLDALYEQVYQEDVSEPWIRLPLMDALPVSVARLLGPEAYPRYMSLMKAQFANQPLTPL